MGDPTNQWQGLKTVLTDLNIGRQDLNWTYPNGTLLDLGYVHAGFYKALEPYFKPLLEKGKPFVTAQEDPFFKQDRPIITVTGHSLGGALATIFASVLRVIVPNADLHLITFGAPRVGSALWVKLFTTGEDGQFDPYCTKGSKKDELPCTRIVRVVNGDDVISLVPTSVGIGDSLVHAGPQLTIAWDGVKDDCKSMVEITSMWSLVSHLSCAISSVSNYHLNYRPNLYKWLQEKGFTAKSWCNANATNF